MNFTIEQKSTIALAMDYAIQWEESLIEAHSTCFDSDGDELRMKCNENIIAFKKLRKRFNFAKDCSIRYNERVSATLDRIAKVKEIL